MLGRKSISLELTAKKPNCIKVQANRNYGICDTLVGHYVYNEKKQKRFVIVKRLSDILSHFQGRQINDSYVITHLKNVLTEKYEELF